MSLLGRLYRSEFHLEFVGRRKAWYLFSAVLVAVSIGSMAVRGFSVGIDFSGGALFQFAAHGKPAAEAEAVLDTVGVDSSSAVIQVLETAGELRVQTPTLTEDQTNRLQDAIAQKFGVAEDDVAVSTVGASWGSTITAKAIQGLVVFLILVVVYLAVRFEWKMALAAMAALIHDLVVTMGIYSLVGFEVTPSTIIALLTILGFSLYDTVVVFDRVRENTAGMGTSSRRTYAEATNDALNETLVRSLNTSLIALIPVASLLFVGAGLLGAGTLKDLALAQFVGIASGTYSSLFFATPLLVDLKKNDPVVRALQQRVTRARASGGREPAQAGAFTAAGSGSAAVGRLRRAAGPAGGERAGRAAPAETGSADVPDAEPADAGAAGGLAPAAASIRAAPDRPRQTGANRAAARKGNRRGRQSGRKRR
jgi:preprotein translocase subunit SecF